MTRAGIVAAAFFAASWAIACTDSRTSDAPRPSPSRVAPPPPPSVTSGGATEPRAAAVEYVGGEVCAGCHAAETRAWAGSDHDLAMQEATVETVLGDFDGAEFRDGGATTVFVRVGDEFAIRTAGRDGEVRDYPVRYVFGVRPLQQLLVDVGGGRFQAYPVAWDTGRRRWFSLYPGEEIDPDDPLHWTRFALNWNQGCADCHSTNLRKKYDVERDRYETTWSDIDVGCEACHGPGARHVAWAEQARDASGEADATKGLLVRLGAGPLAGRDRRRQRVQIETCAPCHSRRAPIHPADAWGAPFTDAYRPELLREGLYHADGQILEEVYVYGSFLQSRMFAEGVTCTDCHDPHSLGLVAEGNALCTRCHEAARYDVFGHTHHAAGQPGSTCVSCHMVETTYMQVDPRRDHGFHIPRPDLTAEIGVPNACGRCHADVPPEWARDRIVEWFGPTRPEDVHEARTLAAGRSRTPGAAQGLARLVADGRRSTIVRATALHLLQTFDDPSAREAARAALGDPEPLVRAQAVANVAASAGRPDDFRELLPLLHDESRLVRTEAAVALTRVAPQLLPAVGEPASTEFASALAEYREGQEASADQPGAQMNLGVVHQNLGQPAEARRDYQRALRLEPAFVPARFNLAMLDALSGRGAEAERGFREVIRIDPDLAAAKYSLGLLLGEDPARLEESAALLREAARAAPDDARIQYNAGLAAQHIGRSDEAEGFLRAAVNLAPDDADLRNALAIFYLQRSRWDEAEPQVVRLRELVGDRPEVLSMLEMVRKRSADAR